MDNAQIQLCVSNTFTINETADFQLRAPAPGVWPYPGELVEDNGLMADPHGLWLPPGDMGVIDQDWESAGGWGYVKPKAHRTATFKPIVVNNPSCAPMRAEILLMFRVHAHIPQYGVAVFHTRFWYDDEPVPGWDETQTVWSGGFDWRKTRTVDASMWIPPGRSRTVHFEFRYRNAEGAATHTVAQMEGKAVGHTLVPYPLQDEYASRVTPPLPDHDVWITDFGAVDTHQPTLEIAQANTAAIQKAIDTIAARGQGAVRVPAGNFAIASRGGTYGTPMLVMKTGVHLLLDDDAVIQRAFTPYPMVVTFGPTDTFGGYDGPSYWTIEGGTIDANGSMMKAKNWNSPTFELSHSRGGTIRGVRFLNVYGNHAVDSTGNKDLLVEDCRFEGYLPPNEATSGEWAGTVWGTHGWPYIEAIQIDRALKAGGAGGAHDGTPTDGLTVRDCWTGPSDTQGPWPVFVGGHAAGIKDGPTYRNVTVENNTVADYLGAGVRLIGVDGALIRNNVLASSHDHPKLGRIDEGSKGAIIVHSPYFTGWESHPTSNIRIEKNRIQDSGNPNCQYAAISINEPWRHYNADGSVRLFLVGQTCRNVHVMSNHVARHQGTAVISSAHVPGVEIRHNRWRQSVLSGDSIVSDDMTNVSDNEADSDQDVWINDVGATAGDTVTDAVAEANSRAIQKAIDTVHAQGRGKVRVPDGVYCVKDQPGSGRTPMFKIRTGVHMLLDDGAVIRRQGHYMVVANFDKNDTFGGYDGDSGWVIEGGTFDGNGAVAAAHNWGYTMVTLSHAASGTFRNVRFLNQFENHVIDSTGNKNVLVEKCRFEGYIPGDETHDFPWAPGTHWRNEGWPYVEAIQIDHSFKGSGAGGAADGTPTTGLKVRDCWVGPSNTAGPYGVFVGAHTYPAATPRHTSILIEGNTVTDYLGAAVRIMHCDGVIIRGNQFASSHDHPKVGTLDDGTKGCILVHSLGTKAAFNTVNNVLIEKNTLQDTGRTGCQYAAISINQPYSRYAPDPTGTQPVVDPVPITLTATNIRILDNHSAGNWGTNVIHAVKSPAVEIRHNRWSAAQSTQSDLYAEDMTNVSDNTPE
ncbi:hypothetical protein [Streptomyces sp. NBC_01304]|uniref:hypothetical protein n=1 Tax=Streptomyces sp. NBC_01304 TaxID=2903818 RepID=UPI002E162100|nr:right-handed parallel beta-helix repeat-containing protein [Streptomyces sp. NBC_01304]